MGRPRWDPARLPLRVRLVAGFTAVMVVVLTAAGGFVYWRVQLALDRGLTRDLDNQTLDLLQALAQHPGDPAAALAVQPLGSGPAQVLAADGTVLAASPDGPARSLLAPEDVRAAAGRTVQFDVGNLLLDRGRRIRVRASAVDGGPRPRVVATTVRLAQRDEALRELLAQLALANLAALALASLVGYRLSRAALLPVERYRGRAEQIAAGATGLRLEVPSGVDDEVTRLGHTLNDMLQAGESSAGQQRQFLADASHELRTPLALLSAEVELALRRPRSAGELERTLSDVAVDLARLRTLADQLLALERAAAPAGRQPACTDAGAAAERAGRRARQRLHDRGRASEVVAEQGVRVAAEPEQLDQVLGNLVDNAAVHGAGAVTVSVREEAGCAVLAVHDEGSGPTAAFVPEAVERFRRADEARTTPGSGLGLALVHTLVVALCGELRLCTPDAHHRYPPLLTGAPRCAHPHDGTTVSAVLPAADPG